MPRPTARIVMRSGYTFDVALAEIKVTKNTTTQRITNLDYTWDAQDGAIQPWVYIDLGEIVAIINLPPPNEAPEIPRGFTK